jgi:hypothetical protein
MDDRLNEDVNSLIKVSGICGAYPAAMLLVAYMEVCRNALNAKIAAIKDMAQVCGISIHGLYVVKHSQKDELVEISGVGAGAIRSYASAQNDLDLKGKVKMKAYQIDKLHKNDLLTKCTEYYLIAKGLGAALADHGFDANDIIEWKKAIDDFTAGAEAPGVNVEINKSHSDDLKKLVADTLRWVKDVMDDTALAYKRKDPAFFKLYTFGREKHKQGHRHRQPGEEEVVTPGEYILDILKNGGIALVGFPILPGNTYLIENLMDSKLRYWEQDTNVPPATIPTDAGIFDTGGELEKTGSELGAPDKPYLFFGNEDPLIDGQVAINIVV